MELLALIAAEPTLLPLWAVLVFAAGMYPVGMLFSCTPCCSPCSLCTEGSLPDTLTVTLSGMPDTAPAGEFITLEFSACFGGGAAARVTAPGGDPEADKGPISAVELTNGGSGYASLGRVAPTLAAYANSSGGGTGAEFSVSTQLAQDDCGRDYWKVSSVVAKTGGSGYSDGDQIVLTVSEGDVGGGAYITLFTARSEPTLTASVSDPWGGGGSGANLSVVLAQNTGTPATWRVDSVTVNNGGSGYYDGQPVAFALGQGDQIDNWDDASASIVTVKVEPTVGLNPSSVSGTGAVLTPVLSPILGGTRWKVSSVTITNPGTGYAANNSFVSYSDDGIVQQEAYFKVTQVDSNGGILAVAVIITDGGLHYKDTGVIGEVSIYSGGRYYKSGSAAGGGDIVDGGIYYREDASLPASVANVTVTVTQIEPSAGTGAQLSAEVDSDPQSPTFGQITAVNIDNGGDGYLAHGLVKLCCGDYYNGMSVVVKRNAMHIEYGGPQGPCKYGHRMCGIGNANYLEGHIRVEYNGPSSPPVVVLMAETTLRADGTIFSDAVGAPGYACSTTFTTQQNVADCSQWLDEDGQPIQFVGPRGQIATVTAGGAYNPTFRNPGKWACDICCKGAELPPEEVEAQVSYSSTAGTDRSGTYVLSRRSRHVFPWVNGWHFYSTHISLIASVEPCTERPLGTPAWSGPFIPGDEVLEGCDFCHKKCYWYVGMWSNVESLTSPYSHVSQNYYTPCQSCEETPQCKPDGKSFTMCRRVATNPNCGEITVEF
jgi:hypothetical protein